MPTLVLVADRARTSLTPAIIARARESAGGGGVTVLSEGEAASMACAAAPDLAALDGLPIDAIVLPGAPRRCRLLVADMDSTIVTGETLDELAAFAGVDAQVAAITRRSMAGEIDFAAALRERVALLRGLDLSALEATWAGVRLMDGARELVATMRAHGAYAVLASGGFTFFAGRVAALCGFDAHRANVLRDDGRALTGEAEEPIFNRGAKLALLRAVAAGRGVALADAMAIGDGANDLDMIGAAGLGIAFHAKPIVAAAAAVRIAHAGLRAALFAQGFSAGELRGV